MTAHIHHQLHVGVTIAGGLAPGEMRIMESIKFEKQLGTWGKPAPLSL